MALSSDAMRMKDANGACSRGNDPGCSANNAVTNKNHLRGRNTQESSAKLTRIQQLSTNIPIPNWAKGKLLGLSALGLVFLYLFCAFVFLLVKPHRDDKLTLMQRIGYAATFGLLDPHKCPKI